MVRAGGDLVVRESWPLVEKAADDVEVVLHRQRRLPRPPGGDLAARDRRRAAHGRVDGRDVRRPGVAAGRAPAGPAPRRRARPRPGPGRRAGLRRDRARAQRRDRAHRRASSWRRSATRTRCGSPRPASWPRRSAATPRGEDLLADDGVDLVIVSTPPNSHAEWTLRALEAGKSVVVEKPFCLTVDEADRQVAAAARARPDPRRLPEPPLGRRLPGAEEGRAQRADRRGLPLRELPRRLRPPLQLLALRRGRLRRRDLRLGQPLPGLGDGPVPAAGRVGLGDHPQAGLARRHQRRPQPGAGALRRRGGGRVHALRPGRGAEAQVLRARHRGRHRSATGGTSGWSPARRSGRCRRTGSRTATARPTCGSSPRTAPAGPRETRLSRAAAAGAAVPPRAGRPGAVGLADVGHPRGQPQEHRAHAGRDRVRGRRRPPGRRLPGR